ncbi:MAG TPA: TonB-dependent receptor plug domain-containing protein, partial [Longimicrobiaceae bacterium]|nr:TonB-dependent receptor plug domain-containing protein [Longimicrobiaceae bacterium]
MSRRTSIIARSLLAAVALLPLAVPAHAQQHRPAPDADGDRTPSILDRRARLSVHDVPIPDALVRLSERSGVPLSFSPTRLPAGLRVSCSCEAISVRAALQRLLRDSGLEFRELRGHIIIFSPGPPGGSPSRGAGAVAATGTPEPVFGNLSSTADSTGALRVRVTDESSGKPVEGAIVSVPDEDLVVGTAEDGELVLNGLGAGTQRVSVQALGYQVKLTSAPVRPGGVSVLAVRLTPQALKLEELVAIGYGHARRRDLTGAITSVAGIDDQAARAPVSSIANLLIGRAAGVYVVSNLGTPGASATIRIRGPNSLTASVEPLYVIDGIPISPGEGDRTGGTALNAVDPSNIESIQILKDASATAIYGARGANGVVLVTTKRGVRGTNRVELQT